MQGKKLGRYTLRQPLGEGGMAVVYDAVVDGPQGFSRPVVIKRIHPGYARDPAFVEMLLTEAKLCALLEHPSIVQVIELGQEDGEFFLAMERVEGDDLARVLAHCAASGRRLPPALVGYVIAELAGALAYAHDLDDDDGRPLEIVHRDVSPSNIMLTRLGTAKLLDFGIARAASHVRSRAGTDRSGSASMAGKVTYLSPEQAEGQRVDARSDQFALGIVFHEALTGERLFRGRDDFDTLRLVRECQVAAPSSRVEGAAVKQLDVIVLRMLSLRPEDRYASCHEVAAALSPLLHALGADAAGLKRFLAELGPIPRPPSPSPSSSSSSSLSPPSPSSRAPLAAVVGLAALGAVAGAVYAFSPPHVPPSTMHHAAPPLAGVRLAPSLPSLAPSASPAPAAARVQLIVLGPLGALVDLDGKPIGRTPLRLELEARSAARAVAVRAPGRARFVTEVPGDRNAEVTATSPRLEPTRPRTRGAADRSSGEIKSPFDD